MAITPKPKRIHVVINPASGQDQPVLAILNRVFNEHNIEWTISVTKREGDAQTQAANALEQNVDVVAVYGGDGTVTAVADVLLNQETPLAILPGGTANVFSYELELPTNLEQAVRLVTGENSVVRAVDVGKVNNDHFLLRVGLGFEAEIIAGADRKLKDQLGFFAYLWSAAQQAVAPMTAHYQIELDGKAIDVDAVTCGVINSGQMGVGFRISPDVRVDDGLLDVFAVRQADLPSIGHILSSVMGLTSTIDPTGDGVLPYLASSSVLHWQAKDIKIRTTPPQTVQFDGEILGKEEIRCSVVPQALKVISPKSII